MLGAYKNEPKTILTILGAGEIGVGINDPRAFFDIGKPINGDKLGTVLGRLTEGNEEGEGTFLGVRGYGTDVNNYEGKSFSLLHSFYGKKIAL